MMIFPRIFWCYCILIFRVMCRDPPTVKIKDQGSIMGMFMKMYRTQSIVAYLGIPYAHPPVGDLRFSPPVASDLPKWSGVRNGSIAKPNCLQKTNMPKPKHRMVLDKLIGKVMDMNSMDTDQYHEDCLYLNIFTPDGPVPPDGYAVVAYLHSGDFSSGSPFEINPFQFVFKQRLIVVTIAYRLHILGFFTTLDGEAPGNFGLMDQSAALMWIKENIKAFGGDDENVTLMGHGSGAASVSAHLLSKEWSDNFFDKAVIMSGSVLERGKVRMPHEYRKIIDKTADAFSCIKTPTSRLVECLRNLDAKSLVEEVTEQRWGPVVDKEITNTTVPFISDIPGDLVERGTLRKVPLLTGFTNQEDIYDLESEQMVEHGMTLEMFDLMIDEIIRADFARVENNETMCAGNNQIAMEAVNFLYRPYPPTEDKIKLRNFFVHFLNDRKYLAPTILTAAHMSKQSDTFVYRFDLKPRTMIDIPEDIGVPHGFEQIFLWGLPYWGTSNITWDNNDKRVSDIIMTLWGNFMKFTNPTQFGVYLKWENFTHDIPNILIIDRSFNMSDFHSLNHHAIKFWNEYYPSVMGFATKCCNSTDDADMEVKKAKEYFRFKFPLPLVILMILVTVFVCAFVTHLCQTGKEAMTR